MNNYRRSTRSYSFRDQRWREDLRPSDSLPGTAEEAFTPKIESSQGRRDGSRPARGGNHRTVELRSNNKPPYNVNRNNTSVDASTSGGYWRDDHVGGEFLPQPRSSRRDDHVGGEFIPQPRSSRRDDRVGGGNPPKSRGSRRDDHVGGEFIPQPRSSRRDDRVGGGNPPKPRFLRRDDRGGGERRSVLRCPSHLKGREIGLWYKENTPHQPKSEHMEIQMGVHTRSFVEEFLDRTAFSFTKNENDLDRLVRQEEAETFEDRINAQSLQPKVPNTELDKKYYEESMEKMTQQGFVEMKKYRQKLPSYKMKDEILDLIEKHQITVISGETGCGKTTQVVQFVLDDFIMKNKGSMCNIVCTQPRRISAVAVAERVAVERFEPLSKSVGYQIRFENKLAERNVGCINFVTTGILLQWMVGEPILRSLTHLFLDEVHERTVESDTVMALLKYILPKRPDLKVILMSATVNQNSFAKYFDGAAQLEIPGFVYPVEEIYLEDILKMVNHSFRQQRRGALEPGFRDYVLPYVRTLESEGAYPLNVTKELSKTTSEELDLNLTASVVRHICEKENEGAILVFLPGLTDITSLNKCIRDSHWYSPSKHLIVLVHSMLPSIEQKDAFSVPPRGVRKIILATPILETSVTVDDVSYVVDCGKIKLSGYDLKHRVATLQPSWISLANAKQRKGRAGRTKPGKCYKLYTKVRQSIFDQYPTPEIQTASLEQVILGAKALKLRRVVPFLEKMMDPPEPDMVDIALKVLVSLNALDNEERLTHLGYHLSKLPMDPRTGKMILMAALFSCVDPVFSIAACLSFKDPFSIPLGQEEALIQIKESFAKGEISDHFIYSEILREWESLPFRARHEFCYNRFLSYNTLTILSEMRRQYGELLFTMNFLNCPNVKDPASNVNSNKKELIKAIVCAGLYPNVAVLRSVKKEAILRTVDNRSVRFHMKSYCNRLTSFESPFFVYHYKLKSTHVFLHDASMINALPLLLFGKSFRIFELDQNDIIEVDEFLKFKTTRRCAMLLKKLRTRLDWTLGLAIQNGEGFLWNEPSEKLEILNGIVQLISDGRIKHLLYKVPGYM